MGETERETDRPGPNNTESLMQMSLGYMDFPVK